MRLRRLGARGMFLGVLAGILAGYSVLSWNMAWRMPSGQIGPGFFPRLIGVTALVLCLVALWRTEPGDGADTGTNTGVIAGASTETDSASPTHRFLLAGVVCACVGFFVLLAVAGALVGGVVFLSGALMLLNPGRRQLVGNAALGFALPVMLYLLFERVLDAQLPSGVF